MFVLRNYTNYTKYIYNIYMSNEIIQKNNVTIDYIFSSTNKVLYTTINDIKLNHIQNKSIDDTTF